MRILIVDDEPVTGSLLASIIKEVPGVITDVASSGKEALEKAAINEYQVVFVDIDMPEMNGMELADILAKKYKQLSLVFATAHPDYALEAFELYSFDYILKPYDEERIKKTVKKLAEKSHSDQSEAAIPVKTKEQMLFLKPSHILYVETRDSGIIIKTSNRNYATREDIHAFEVRLQSYDFFRCHRSYLVNLRHIKEIIPSGRTYQIILDTDDRIPLSRKHERLLRTKLQQK
ncbi:Signal transduction response regulator, receiver domain [Syntrophomonas zehnderi OL-4]|uniref:Stage 0 sporulation protein A homolog n=1 Tax=Syntrophomonas zehnderi OL-4 TaxID=690567 RepID=A0A0E4GCB3_9FIRM|nr:LytTR family DNA-binding domain-containing protein [Syntrophomonas zehnderi]CFY09644.1 Signal transduction response regulator, receiver domain [Syntrophomonas zehnderi OL-4]